MYIESAKIVGSLSFCRGQSMLHHQAMHNTRFNPILSWNHTCNNIRWYEMRDFAKNLLFSINSLLEQTRQFSCKENTW